MATPDEKVAHALARLSAAFVAELPDQVRAVEDGMTAWLAAPGEKCLFDVVSHRVHQLKGSGSTFGCPGISRAAGILERRLAEYRGEVEQGERPIANDVVAAMTQLRSEAELAGSRPDDKEGGA